MRLHLEDLEDRLAPAVTIINVNDNSGGLDNPTNVTASSLGANVTLRDAINAANNSGGSSNSYVINLQANTIYDLTTIDNYWYGPDGLPGIFSNITIQGNGAVIQRDSGTPNFRLFYVSGGLDGPPPGSLTLDNLTLEGGVAQGGSSDLGGGGLGAGGAIFNQGTLTLSGVTLTGNEAAGGSGGDVSIVGFGGGGMGQDASFTNGGGFGGPLNVPTGYTGSIGGIGGSGSPAGGGGGGGGFGVADAGSNGSGTTGGVGGGQGGFGGSGGGFTGKNYSGDGGGGSFGSGGAGGGGGNFGGGGVAISGATAGGGGGGVGGGGSSDGGPGINADGGPGGFGGGGGIGLSGGNGGFGGGGGGYVSNSAGLGGFGGGNGGSYFSNSTVGGGGAGMGGGVFNMMGSLTLTNSTLTANTAQGGSGYNGGSGYGGAIFNLDGVLNITFCTIAVNTVQGGTGAVANGSANGGAVYNLAYGNNISTGGPQSATATILDSILSNSTGGKDLTNNVVNGINPNTAKAALSGPNLVMSTSGAITGSATVTANPQLGPLQNNGGPTPTMAITSSSPAYQAGTPVPGITTDQRGRPRQNPPSLGSFDVKPTTNVTITAANVSTPYSPSAQTVALSATVTDPSNPKVTVNEGSVTFTVKNGQTVLGTFTSTVTAGKASANFTVPAGLAAGDYTIFVSYTDSSGNFTDTSDNSGTLTITPAGVATTAQNVSTVFSLSTQTVTLNATVVNLSVPSNTVNEGAVTFTIQQGSLTFGSVTGTVSGGKASADFILPAQLAAGTYTIAVSYNDVQGNFGDGGDTNATLTISSAKATTTAVNASAVYSTDAQSVTLQANVTSPIGTVNEGTVTFTILQGSTVIGTPVTSATVSSGQALVSYALPAGLTNGNYTLTVTYSDSKGNFLDTSDVNGTFTVLSELISTTAVNASAIFSPNAQSVKLTANLTDIDDPGDTVGEGAVTFTIQKDSTIVGSVNGTASGTTASANLTLPAGLAAGTYTLVVNYSDSKGNYIDSGDTNGTLTIAPANVITTAANASAVFSPNDQSIALGTTVADASIPSDTVNEGVVTFTIKQGSTVVGNVRGTVSDGKASANFDWSAGRAAGSYTLAVSYSDSQGNFLDSGDTNATLTVAPANVTTTASNVTVTLPNDQTATLSAAVADTSIATDTVDQGTVTFTILNGTTVIGTPVQATVSGDTASGSFTLPSGLAAGNYIIGVNYTDSAGNFSDSGDTTGTLTVLLVPTVTANPSNQGVSAGQTVSFTAAASGNPAPTVQWQISTDSGKTWTDISGATTTTLIVSNVQPSQNGDEYRAIFTSSLGSATTTAATLTVLFAPSVTTNPTNQSVSAGGTATFTAAASGDPIPTVQWQVSSDGGQTWTNISGATSTTLTLSNVSVSQNGNEYQAVFTNGGGTQITTAATLTVLTPPSVTINPTSQTIQASEIAIFRATAGGTPTPSVQWQVSSDGGKTWTNISGATSTTLTLSNVPFSQNGNEYRAVFTNGAGSATTSAALLTVQTVPVVTSISSIAFTIGQVASFTVTATGSPTPTLTEFGALPTGITFADNGNGTATLAGTAAAGTQGTYHITIAAHNGIGSDFLQSFTFTVNPVAVPTSPPPSPVTSTPTSAHQPPALNVPPLLALFDSLLGGFETINANGTETVTDILFGTTLIVSTYDSSGNFVSAAVLGFTLPNWVWYLKI